MTRYFEVMQRDSAARIGRLMLDQRILTPAILNSELLRRRKGSIIDCGSVWDDHVIESADPSRLLILPHRSLPLYAPQELIDRPSEPFRSKGATGEVIHPMRTDVPEARDLYVIGAAALLENRARLLAGTVLKLKNSTSPDTALYAPALATPENLAVLIYLGIDLVDDTAAIIKGYQNLYLTREGEKPVDRLHEFPCACEICTKTGTPERLQSLPATDRARLLARHNIIKLDEELRLVRERIRDGSLRCYVEKQCRSRPYLTAVLRLLDQEHTYLEERTPIVRKSVLIANTAESQNRVEVTRFAERVLSRFAPPGPPDTLVILPCSARKPYSRSRSHATFIDALSGYRQQIHEIILTSPLGVVPRELETVYPAAHYDIAVTGQWSLDETAWVASCLRAYLGKHTYRKIIAHVSGGFAEVCRTVEHDLGIEITYSVIEGEGPLADDSLASLRESVAESVSLQQPQTRSKKSPLRTVRAIADYQFGQGAGVRLIPDHAQIRSSRSGFWIFVDGKQIASSSGYGTITLTLAGAARMPPDIYRARIDDFLPKGSILAPGVIDADPQIRQMDEVIVEGKMAFGVGRARMSGREMVRSSRGLAVDLRAVEAR
jgi:archaeosine synthase